MLRFSVASPMSYMPCAYVEALVPAGFPSPAADYTEQSLDLNELCIRHPAATYFVRVSGDSMIGAGIQDGDMLIVDRSIEPKSGDIVIAGYYGELTVKRLDVDETGVRLVPMNPAYPVILVPNESELSIQGVVVHTLHSFRRIS